MTPGGRGRTATEIRAGFIAYAAVKTLGGAARDVHWMVYLASLAFGVYFLLPLIEPLLR